MPRPACRCSRYRIQSHATRTCSNKFQESKTGPFCGPKKWTAKRDRFLLPSPPNGPPFGQISGPVLGGAQALQKWSAGMGRTCPETALREPTALASMVRRCILHLRWNRLTHRCGKESTSLGTYSCSRVSRTSWHQVPHHDHPAALLDAKCSCSGCGTKHQ